MTLSLVSTLALPLEKLGALDWPLGYLTFPLVSVSAHSVGHVLALPPLDNVGSEVGHILGQVTLAQGLGHALPLIDIVALWDDAAGLGQLRHEVIRWLSGSLMAENRLGQVSLTSQQIIREH